MLPRSTAHRIYRCRCVQCLVIDPSGRQVTKHVFYAHRTEYLSRHDAQCADAAARPALLQRKASYSAIRTLDAVDSELDQRIGAFIAPSRLVFRSPPGSEVTGPDTCVQNSGQYALTSGEPCNSAILDFERWIYDSLSRIQAVRQPGDAAVVRVQTMLQERLEAQLEIILGMKVQEWAAQAANPGSTPLEAARSNYHRVDPRPKPYFHDWTPAVLACQILVAILHLLGHASEKMCGFVLECLPLILLTWSRPVDRRQQLALDGMGKDVRSIFHKLQLEPITRDYICCPSCFKLYLLREHSDPDAVCVGKSCADAEPCGTHLYRSVIVQGQPRRYPARLYLHHDFHHWLANFLNREGIEDMLDVPRFDGAPTTEVDDIWGGTLLREFKDRDGKQAFFRLGTNDSRYAFALAMDGFGPFGASSGKVVHAFGIFLVCLNLPLHLRYLEENMYLAGIVPGPNAPKLDQLNYLLAPLVDDFCKAWDPGLYVSRTAKHPGGRRVLAAIIPIICDMLATKQALALTSHNSNFFCTYCWLTHDKLNDLDCSTWPLREREDWLRKATAYLEATTLAEREKLVELYGVRYTELFRLSYFDPAQQTDADTVHALFLRGVSQHTRIYWCMTTKVSASDADLEGHSHGKARRTSVPVSANALEKGLWAARNDSLEDLRKRLTPNKLLYAVCERLNIQIGEIANRKARREAHVQALLDYRRNPKSYWPPLPKKDPRRKGHKGKVTKAELDEAHQVYQSSHDLQRIRRAAMVLLVIARLKRAPARLKAMKKDEMIPLLESQRREDGFANGDEVVNPPRRLLGGVIMKEVHKDMEKTRHHSSIAAVASNVGSKAAGTISADHNLTFFTKNLVVTIIRLFGKPSHPRHEDARNFMHLVTAIAAADSRRMSEALRDVYARHAHTYLTGVLVLHPSISLTPSQHLMLHLPRFLRSMGPVKAHRAFVFERFIFLLKSVPTNNKAAEAALTMFRKMVMRQNLRALLRDASAKAPYLPTIVRTLADIFSRRFSVESRGSLGLDILSSAPPDLGDRASSDEEDGGTSVSEDDCADGALDVGNAITLTREMIDALRRRYPGIRLSPERKACRTAKFAIGGETYKARRSTYMDAQVAVMSSSGDDWEPGEIEEILVPLGPKNKVLHANTFAVVKKYQSLSASQARHDHWRQFGPRGGRVYRLEMRAPSLVFSDEIISPVTLCTGICDSIQTAHALFIPKDSNGVILTMAVGRDAFLDGAPAVQVCL